MRLRPTAATETAKSVRGSLRAYYIIQHERDIYEAIFITVSIFNDRIREAVLENVKYTQMHFSK